MNKQRYFIDTEGNDDEAYREAMKFACEIAEEDPEISRVTLLILTKFNTGWLDRIFGEKDVKKLFSGIKFKDCKPTFKIDTVRTYRKGYNPSEVVITFGLSVEEINKIDDSYSVKVIIAVPWLKNSLMNWIQAWNPIELRTKQKTLDAIIEPSCIVKRALHDLSSAINMSTGITYPMDEELAKTYILALHKYEPSIEEEIITSYLVRELGWEVEDANDIKQLINTLNAGKHFKGGTRTGLKGYYKGWQDECK